MQLTESEVGVVLYVVGSYFAFFATRPKIFYYQSKHYQKLLISEL